MDVVTKLKSSEGVGLAKNAMANGAVDVLLMRLPSDNGVGILSVPWKDIAKHCSEPSATKPYLYVA